ncbi:MAG: DUF6441 family protein [Paracraurococcus sp.]
MPLITSAVLGDLRAGMEAEVRDAARAMRHGVERAGREVQAELRAQARSAGFTDRGRAVANAWRLSLYPPPATAQRTLRHAALVWTNAPKLVDAFDRGLPVVARGGRYLAFPTPYNAAGGRRGASARGGLRVTPAQMQAARHEAFVIRSKSNPSVRLWCLRVRAATGIARRARRLRLFVGPNAEILTGRHRGQQRRAREVLAQGFVPMFFLLRQVSLRKRLDVAAVRRRAPGILARALAAELGRRA